MWYSTLGSQHRDFQLFFLISHLQKSPCYPLYRIRNSNRSEGNNPPRSKCCTFSSAMGLDSCSMPNTMMFSLYCTHVAVIHKRENNVPPLQREETSGSAVLKGNSFTYLYSLSSKQHLKISAEHRCLFKVSYLNNTKREISFIVQNA